MFRVFLSGADKKKHAVWLHGPANTGKSWLAKQLGKIFVTETFMDSDSKYNAAKVRNEYATQLLNMDEANFKFLFKPSNLSRTKKLLEGQGWHIETKYQDPELAYAGAYTYLSSNRLPAMSEFPVESVDWQDTWEPFLYRCEFVPLAERLPGPPDFDFRLICALWLDWLELYPDPATVPLTGSLLDLSQPALGKRRRPEVPAVDRGSFAARTAHDKRWSLQSTLPF